MCGRLRYRKAVVSTIKQILSSVSRVDSGKIREQWDFLSSTKDRKGRKILRIISHILDTSSLLNIYRAESMAMKQANSPVRLGGLNHAANETLT